MVEKRKANFKAMTENHLRRTTMGMDVDDEQENYRWLQWETRVPKSLHEYYIDELLVWASDIID